MTITLDHAQVYDIEVFPNLFTLTTEHLWSDTVSTWEISPWRDDRAYLFQWFSWLAMNDVPMIGYNNESYDYPMIHHLFHNPQITNADIYAKSKSIINTDDRFGHTIWPRDRFAPQIDLLKVHHFDNQAKRTSLKALQVNMRSENVRESQLPFDEPVQYADIDGEVIPYNKWDVRETKRFALYSKGALEFRLGLIPQFGVECLSWNDTKIGEKMLEGRLGEDVCYERVPIPGTDRTRKSRRQTHRQAIPVQDMIFPYVQFRDPAFQRVHQFMASKTLTPADMVKDDEKKHESPIKTSTEFGGVVFKFGSGGVHASVERQRFVSNETWVIEDIDVEGMYPSISNVNELAPEHLGAPFVHAYAQLPIERKQHAKGTHMNGLFKLGGNAAWGKSKSIYSCFYDPKYALTIPINGQLMICMLVEWLKHAIPDIIIIQANTDGCTYMIRREALEQAHSIQAAWENYTRLKLERVLYESMFIRDVNNYVAVTEREPGDNKPPKVKRKGAYWSPDPLNYDQDITNAGVWHKDFNPTVVARAAVAAMVDGVPPDVFIRCHTDPFDFMLRGKCDRSSRLMMGDREMQRVMRYFMAVEGEELIKISPPAAGGVVGQWKRANGVTKAQYEAVMAETGGQWDARVCTRNQSKYEDRVISLQAGWRTADCTLASDFRFDNLNYDWYISEARKLII